MNINAVDCTVQFATDATSERCVLGISISTGLQFAPLGPVDGDKIKILISAHQHNFLHLLDSKPFVAAECVICLDDKPDTILYPCRHQCVHFACIKDVGKSCPVCRAAIRACDTPPVPVMPHPKPERRAQQSVPMVLLVQERELSKRMLEIEREKSNKAVAAANKTKEAVAVLQNVLSTIDQLKPAIKSVIDPPPITCTKGHVMDRITKSPYAPHYQHYTCDRCQVVHSDSFGPLSTEGMAPFHHCFSCANFDLCPACSRQ